MKYDVSVLLFSHRKKGSNRNKWIKQAINSVKNQKGLEIQFIIMDDGSHKKLERNLIKSTKNVHIEYYYYPKHEGKYRMIVWGFRLCKADMVTTLHDDDYLPDEESLLNRYKCYTSRKDTVLIWSDAIYTRGNKRWKRSTKKYGRVKKHDHKLLLKKNYICGASFLLDRELANMFTPDPDLKHAEEYDVWLSVSEHALKNKNGIYYCPKVTAVYRLHKEQNWEKARKKGRKGRELIRQKIQDRHR